MLINRKTLRTHRIGLAAFVAGTAAAIFYYVSASAGKDQLPGGSSVPGLIFGSVGGVIIVFEMLLWLRKKLRGFRKFPIGSAQRWMRWHIWLGLLSVPLIIMHGGVIFYGGLFASILLWLYLAVIASGIVGLLLQHVIPRRMIELVPGETIYSQIDVVCQRLARDADMLVLATCGPGPAKAETAKSPEPHKEPAAEAEAIASEPLVVIGAKRSMRNFRGQILPVDPPENPVPDSALLRSAFETEIRPFLRDGKKAKSAVRNSHTADEFFQELREALDPATHPTIDALTNWVQQRRQFDVQTRLQFWLHGWMIVHLPLSVIMFVMMVVHMIFALKYSGRLSLF